ncbi:isocitrate lyase/PEP mutase family protein [Streptomyces malaysiense]|uniref:isocitrate lyase/PEP mutase family protein n=1 Tax=Streptomyces malaysiense TaxID=1428626 RepID=UPI0009A0EB25|nr:isocitrate lyase/phosphoenolpyruvate mutase family protein [Streptomyces malaysiense]
MTGTVEVLRALHRGRPPGDPLILPGPWDAASARALAQAGFEALATPSAGLAAALGYVDGETPADEMFAAVARITRAVDVPVTADIEDGYGIAPGELVERLLEAGAVGCNIEDSARGTLKDPGEHADYLAEFCAAAAGRIFLNARVDVFVHGDGNPERAVERAASYVAAGAECVYPIMAPVAVLPLLRSGVEGPLNALALLTPDGPSPAALGGLGATRITFGPQLQRRATAAAAEAATGLR